MDEILDKSLIEKSYKFALKVVKLTQYLQNTKKEFVLSKQLLDGGTSIGSLITEGKYSTDDADLLQKKLVLAQSEAYKTKYWLSLLAAAEYINKAQFENVLVDCKEIFTLLAEKIKILKDKS